jgi:hypothetical protein
MISNETTDHEQQPPQNRPVWARRVIALISILAMIGELIVAQGDISNGTNAQASAIQIIQLWTPHIYYLMLIIGFTIAGYIWTRATD